MSAHAVATFGRLTKPILRTPEQGADTIDPAARRHLWQHCESSTAR